MPEELIDPRKLTKENSFFYDSELIDAKYYPKMTIVVALKKDFRIPGEKEQSVKDISDFFYGAVLYQRVIYLLKTIGFADLEIPKFFPMQDYEEYIEDFDYELDVDDLREEYYFMWAERVSIYREWKMCDFIYSTRVGGKYISLEDIIDERKNWVGDNLIFLYAIYSED